MPSYHHLLAAVDPSPASLHALGEALQLACPRLSAVAVGPYPPGGTSADPSLAARLSAPYEQTLALALEFCREKERTLITRLAHGEPHEALCRTAQELACDLLVIGKRGRDLPPGLLMGKVTERVIGYCPLDVLVVPEEATLRLDRLLLPVDGSRFSRQAVKRALGLAQETQGEALAVAVLDAPPGFAAEAPEVARELMGKLEKLLAGVAREADAQGVACGTRIIAGSAWRTIVDLSREWQAGLIVMGSHGRTGLKRLLMGSVTERVVGLAPCPVLVVKATERAG